jgi:hypothetical protein
MAFPIEEAVHPFSFPDEVPKHSYSSSSAEVRSSIEFVGYARKESTPCRPLVGENWRDLLSCVQDNLVDLMTELMEACAKQVEEANALQRKAIQHIDEVHRCVASAPKTYEPNFLLSENLGQGDLPPMGDLFQQTTAPPPQNPFLHGCHLSPVEDISRPPPPKPVDVAEGDKGLHAAPPLLLDVDKTPTGESRDSLQSLQELPPQDIEKNSNASGQSKRSTSRRPSLNAAMQGVMMVGAKGASMLARAMGGRDSAIKTQREEAKLAQEASVIPTEEKKRISRLGSTRSRFSSRQGAEDDGEDEQAMEILHQVKAMRATGLRRNNNMLDLDQEVRNFKEWLHSDRAERKLDQVMAIVVMANIAQLGVSADVAREWAGWLIFDGFFAIFFLIEFMLKWYMRGFREHFVEQWMWTTFVGVIIGVAITELLSALILGGSNDWGASISVLRVVRLMRLVRIIKVLKLPIFKDLLMMLDGLIGGARTLFWSFILLVIPIFASALMLRETVGENKDESLATLIKPFSNLPSSFFTIFRCIMGDCSAESGQPLPVLISDTFGWGFSFSYICLIVITSFGLFNVIIAIYVENIVVAAKKNESIQRQRRLRDVARLNQLLAEMVSEFLDALDSQIDPSQAASLEIKRSLFDEVVKRDSVNLILEKIEIPYEDRLDLFDVLDADGSGALSLGEVLEGLKRLRGEPRRSDIIALGLAIRALQKRVHTDMTQIYNVMRRCVHDLQMLKEGQISTFTATTTSTTTETKAAVTITRPVPGGM